MGVRRDVGELDGRMELNPIGIAVPFFLLFIGIEYVILWKQNRQVRLNDAVTDLSCSIGDQMLGVFLKPIALFPYIYVVENFAIFQFETSNIWVWVIGAVAVDFFYYFYHRLCHRLNIGWATHVVHHQSEEYNLSVALRQPWFSMVYSWVVYMPLAFIGLPFEVYAITFAFNLLYQFWIHTETIGKLGPIEWIFNTPSHHRVHHGTNPEYVDKNYAGIFIIWDRMFGTFEEEKAQALYGTLKPLRSWNAAWANVEPWINLSKRSLSLQSWWHKLYVWFAPPEWTPEGPFDTRAAFDGPDRGYDMDAAKGNHLYIVIHLSIAAILVGLVLTFEQRLDWTIKGGTVVFLIWTVFAWGAMFEGKPYAKWLEVSRLAFLCTFTTWLVLS